VGLRDMQKYRKIHRVAGKILLIVWALDKNDLAICTGDAPKVRVQLVVIQSLFLV